MSETEKVNYFPPTGNEMWEDKLESWPVEDRLVKDIHSWESHRLANRVRELKKRAIRDFQHGKLEIAAAIFSTVAGSATFMEAIQQLSKYPELDIPQRLTFVAPSILLFVSAGILTSNGIQNLGSAFKAQSEANSLTSSLAHYILNFSQNQG